MADEVRRMPERGFSRPEGLLWRFIGLRGCLKCDLPQRASLDDFRMKRIVAGFLFRQAAFALNGINYVIKFCARSVIS